MNTSSTPASLADLQREQIRLRAWLAVLLIVTICAFALLLSWLAQDSPLQPLLMVKVTLLGLVTVYAVGVGVAAIYARWIHVRREPAVREYIDKHMVDRNMDNKNSVEKKLERP
jgi:hypothetical protein